MFIISIRLGDVWVNEEADCKFISTNSVKLHLSDHWLQKMDNILEISLKCVYI